MSQRRQLINLKVLKNRAITPVELDDLAVLVIRSDDTVHVIENRCGHFGVRMEDGEIRDHTIVCPQHGIAFSLMTGENVNRPWEDCDVVRVFEAEVVDDIVWISTQ